VTQLDERGTVTVFVVGFMLALLLVAGLVIDGGNVLAARREAANVAESAARAGAQAIDVGAARTSAGTQLDASAAIARAESYLNQTGYEGTASVHGNQVLVEVTITRRMSLLGLAGITSMTVHGLGQAHGVRAVAQGGY
jgi:Flp pilus assembly protein TadG